MVLIVIVSVFIDVLCFFQHIVFSVFFYSTSVFKKKVFFSSFFVEKVVNSVHNFVEKIGSFIALLSNHIYISCQHTLLNI